MHRDCYVTVNYDDNEGDHLNPLMKNWHFESGDQTTSASTSQAMNDWNDAPRVLDVEPNGLKLLKEHFGNKSFMNHQAQGFEQYTLNKSYKAEKTSFLETVKCVPHCEEPRDANIKNSHILYKISDEQ